MAGDRAHFVYIVCCADGSFYTGYARDPRARLKQHNGGKGARYTSGRRPVHGRQRIPVRVSMESN